jgi:NitT/TauT family transport system substrate-binding protein
MHQVVLGKKAQELVQSPKDLEKLTIGMPRGAPVALAIQGMARDTGVELAKIRFVDLAPPEAIKALAKGTIDAMAAWAPWVFKPVQGADAKVAFTGSKSFLPGKDGPVQWLRLHAGVVASARMVKDHPNTLKAVLRALVKATYLINNDRDTAVGIVAKALFMEDFLAKDLMELNVYSMEQTEQPVKAMAEQADFLYTLDRIKKTFPPEQVFVTTLLEDVEPLLVKWKSKTEAR